MENSTVSGLDHAAKGLAGLPLAAIKAAVMSGAVALLAGCVNVAAPDKPIVIELNINIRQEVVYRLDAEAARTIEENRDIF